MISRCYCIDATLNNNFIEGSKIANLKFNIIKSAQITNTIMSKKWYSLTKIKHH